MLHPFCNKISSRLGAFAVGTIDVILGLTGILLVLLEPDDRHLILNPMRPTNEPKYLTQTHDIQKDSFQFFIEYWMPSLSLLLVGILVIITAMTKRNLLATLTFVLSTVQMAGFVAGLFALLLSGVNRVGILPFFIVTLFQFYFHYVIAHFTHFAWGFDFSSDTQDLIDPRMRKRDESLPTLNYAT